MIDRAPPTDHRDDDGGSGGGWAWLVTVPGVVEAELLRGLLEANGIIPVHLDATDPSPGAWLFLSGDINALVRVFVPRALLDDARLALLEHGPPAPEEGSDLTRSRRRPAFWAVIALLVVLVFGWRLFSVICGSGPC